jgi:hypothetical protein
VLYNFYVFLFSFRFRSFGLLLNDFGFFLLRWFLSKWLLGGFGFNWKRSLIFEIISRLGGTNFAWRLLYRDICASRLKLFKVLLVVSGFDAVNDSLRNRVKVWP